MNPWASQLFRARRGMQESAAHNIHLVWKTWKKEKVNNNETGSRTHIIIIILLFQNIKVTQEPAGAEEKKFGLKTLRI
jgi:hypothetical protein